MLKILSKHGLSLLGRAEEVTSTVRGYIHEKMNRDKGDGLSTIEISYLRRLNDDAVCKAFEQVYPKEMATLVSELFRSDDIFEISYEPVDGTWCVDNYSKGEDEWPGSRYFDVPEDDGWPKGAKPSSSVVVLVEKNERQAEAILDFIAGEMLLIDCDHSESCSVFCIRAILDHKDWVLPILNRWGRKKFDEFEKLIKKRFGS